MPRPPPPAAALTIRGKPMDFEAAMAASIVSTSPSEPGTQGIPASSTVCLAVILSPMMRMCSGLGPMKVMPWASTISAKRAFSDRKP
jgi:hypothetical protein